MQHFFIWLILIPIITSGIFAFNYHRNQIQLINGYLFNIAFYGTGICLVFYLISLNNTLVNAVIVIVVIIITLLIFFIGLTSVGLLLWNARIVWKRESHTLANMLTLFLAIGILLFSILFTSFNASKLPNTLNIALGIINFLAIFYVPLVFFNFLTVLILYQFNHPKLNQNYIIILGAGLIDGDRVSNLLAGRINRGISFYHKQIAAGGPIPKMVFSGGQGKDEKLSEAQAMQNYAINQGIPAADTLVESQSKNTLQNMQFSKQLIETDSTVDLPNIIFVSNNYHTYRAAIFANQANLNAQGIGAKTAKYFLPNAVIREFIAIFLMHKKRHAILIGSIICLVVILSILSRTFL